jgi:hypothetical protein
MVALGLICIAGFSAVLLLIAHLYDFQRITKMDQATILANLATLKAAVEVLINRPVPPQGDLQPVADAIQGIQASVDAKNATSV